MHRQDWKQQGIAMGAGILSGCTKLAVGHPFDTIKVRVQTQDLGKFKGPLDCLMTTIKREGFRALYKGATPPLFGWAMMDATQMGSLHFFRTYLCNKSDPLGTDNNYMQTLTTKQHALAGFGAGMVVSFVASPIELLKAKLQVQYQTKTYSGPIDCAKQLIRVSGPTALYQGLSGCLLFRSFFWVLWGSYHIYTQKFTEMGVPDHLIPFFAGGCSANTFWAISFPADVIKNKMMTQPPHQRLNIVSCARQIYSTLGVKGFYRGFTPCFLRSFPTNGAAILVFESVSRYGRDLI